MRDLSKEELINFIESGQIVPSLNSLELERNSLSDYRYRLTSRHQNLAELYHENSKLNEFNKSTIISDEVLFNEVRNWYLSTTCKVKEEDIDRRKSGDFFREISSFPIPIRGLLSHLLRDKQSIGFLYSLDLLLLYGERVYRLIPYSEYLMLEKTYEDISLFSSAVLNGSRGECSLAIAYLAVIGLPWRHMIFEGPRGYRSMLMGAGSFLNNISRAVKEHPMLMKVYNSFLDNKINRFLNLDGVESYVLSVVGLYDKEVE